MKLLIAVTAALMAATSANAVNLLTNGGFEDPGVMNTCCSTVVVPNSFPGWDVTAGDVNLVIGTFASSNGNLAFAASQYLDLIGESNAGAISQSFATVMGKTYQLSFAYSHNLFGGLPLASATYSLGTLNGTITHSTGSNSNLDWQTFTGTFVAGAGPTSTLSFVNTINGSNAGIFLDAVSVTAVPEAATWGMMIVGFGAIGAAARRRRNIAAHA